MHYKFEWNEEKAHANERKHSVSFEEATGCFLDVFAIESFDIGHSFEEDRFIIMGVSERNRLLVVAFTLRDRAIRIISAREALLKERVDYEKQARSR